MNDNRFYVYLLKDSRNGEIFYVGKGTKSRKDAHTCKSSLKIKSMKNNKIKNILNGGATVIAEIHTNNITSEQACELEISLIKQYGRKDIGTGILTNHTSGGDSGAPGHKMTPEQYAEFIERMKINPPMKGKKHSEQSKIKMKAYQSKREGPTAETREKLSKTKLGMNNPNYNKPGTMLGRKHSPEALMKIKANRAMRCSPTKGKKFPRVQCNHCSAEFNIRKSKHHATICPPYAEELAKTA